MISIVFKNEWRQLKRSKALLAAILLLFASGIYAIHYGHTFNSRQLAVLHTIDTAQTSKEKRYISYYDADTTTKEGKKEYEYAKDAYMSDWFAQKPVYKKPTPFAALSIGQNDNQPYYYKAWILNNIYNNKMQEIRNPDKLLAGNFDLSFVLLYLSPLFIIAFGFNSLSGEKEAGTYTLLKVQGKNMRAFILTRLLFQFTIVVVISTALFAVGILWNNISFTENTGAIAGWWGISLVYLLFWFALLFAMIGFNKSSGINALVLVSCWIFFLLLMPSAVNYLVQKKYPENERLSMIKADRKDDYELWNKPKKFRIDSFYKLYPQYTSSPVTDTNTVDLPAYVELSQRHTNVQGRSYDSTIVRRLQTALSANIINPVFAVQYGYNQIAKSEINHYLQFTKAVVQYQAERRHYIFGYMLADKPFNKEAYIKYPAFSAVQTTGTSDAGTVWPLVLWIIVLGATGVVKTRRV